MIDMRFPSFIVECSFINDPSVNIAYFFKSHLNRLNVDVLLVVIWEEGGGSFNRKK